MRIVELVVVILVVLIVASWITIRQLLRRSLPVTKGMATVEGIAQEVHIRRDEYGVPHIEALSLADAAYACGYTHAQDRLWQMEFLRRVGRGRVSEFAGADGLETDRFIRRLGLVHVVDAEVAALIPEEREMLEAYAVGVNRVMTTARLPLEFGLLKIDPDPWTPADSLLAIKLLSLGLSLNWEIEQQRLDVVAAIGPVRAARLHALYPDANPTILGSVAAAVGNATSGLAAMYNEAAKWIPAVGAGSNSWVVAGKRTSTGRPLLCNDPHLAPALPGAWYQMHVSAGEDFESTGVSFPGLPFIVIGHNRHCAWGFTNSFADVQDLVIEDFSDASHSRYRVEKGFVPSRVRREVISVKGQSDVVEEVVVTRHGPLVGRLDDPKRGMWRGLALQWTSLSPGTGARALLGLQRAHDWASFRTALGAFDSPSMNAVYADVEGHIGYALSGRIPVRKGAASGLPTVGWTGEATWVRYLTHDEMPTVFDPTDGIIVTANNRVVGSEYPHYVANDYMNGYRARRIRELLGTATLDATRMAEIQMDIMSLPAQDAATLLSRYTWEGDVETARQLLCDWDNVMAPDRREPLLHEAFMRELSRAAFEPTLGEAWATVSGEHLEHPLFGYPGNALGRFTPHLLELWGRNDTTELAPGSTWEEVARTALSAAVDSLGGNLSAVSRWGKAHAMRLEHLLVESKPILHLLFPRVKIPLGGSADTVMATSHSPNRPYATRVWAPSWRQIMDVGEWDLSTGIHFPGQSGHPRSRHWDDLVPLWRSNEQRPLAWSAQPVHAASRRELTLLPAAPQA